jgi:hypothetical protein
MLKQTITDATDHGYDPDQQYKPIGPGKSRFVGLFVLTVLLLLALSPLIVFHPVRPRNLVGGLLLYGICLFLFLLLGLLVAVPLLLLNKYRLRVRSALYRTSTGILFVAVCVLAPRLLTWFGRILVTLFPDQLVSR